MHPVPGKAEEVARIMDDLVEFYSKQPGWISGYKLQSADEVGDIGRVTVWKSLEDADAAAQTNHNMSKRSDLIPLIEEGSHEERSFHAEEETKLLTGLLRRLGI
jgi:hypothetical protein